MPRWEAVALALALLVAGCFPRPVPAPRDYDVVLAGGRVIDPESGFDAVANVGIRDGRIAALGPDTLAGRETIDARGLVVAPGFIDLHSHGQDAENWAAKARDGVTTALELEIGVGDVDRWYAQREGTALVNYGASAGHIPARMAVMHEAADFLPRGDAAHRAASDAEVAEIAHRLADGLARGALGVGFGLQYTPGATRWEVLEAFRVAARFGAPAHVHLRHMGDHEPGSSVEALEEMLAAA